MKTKIYFIESSTSFNKNYLDSPSIAGSEKTLINITNELSKNDDLIIDEKMKPNDVVFVPKGINHHVIGLTKRLSISFPMIISSDSYPPQDRTWIELV